ncbi:hypothetical protein M413DRAFT_282669 [Hebeloma cylindrosporum]|uniref:F-box domain-containing protein n=1 Tax=Hebeloma cylindrosporum TaxID=76867 RepID=A0A0C3BY19_HEBCY|nr:hypothetical protein M413DRAFT_282669 [Hebeloma cylindrosporum h7]
MSLQVPSLSGCQCKATKVLRPDRCIMPDGKPCSACTEDIQLERQLQDLEKLAQEIHAKRRALRTTMNQNHDRSLIPKFPPEIASRVFFHYSLASLRLDTYAKINTLFLGAVCHKWRELAWATPELWTSINVGQKLIHQWSLSAGLLFSEWLERSGTLPLSIRFLDPINNDSANDVYRVVMDLLNKHSARWYDVYLDIPARHLHRFSRLSQENCVLVRLVLSLGACSNDISPPEAALSTFSMNCSPRELKLVSLSLKYVDIRWNNLTIVYLASLRANEFFEVLRRSPHLTTITLLKIEPPSSTFTIPTSRIPYPRVRSFELLNVGDATVLTQLLKSVSFPSLDKWTLSACAFPLESMISFIETSSFSLKTFQMVGNRHVSNQIHNLLRHLPTLEILSLRFRFHYIRVHNPPSDDDPEKESFFKLLCSPDDTAFLPRLQTLKFGYDLAVPLDAIPQLFTAGHRRSLEVEVDHEGSLTTIADSLAERFLGLVDEGFNVRVLRCGKVDMLEEYKVKRRSRVEESSGSAGVLT